MDELIKLICERAVIDEEAARRAAQAVTGFLKDGPIAPLAAHLDGIAQHPDMARAAVDILKGARSLLQVTLAPIATSVEGGTSMTSLLAIEGIGPEYATKLKAKGIRSIEGLLKSAFSADGRKGLALDAGISEKLILEWANRADLFRIKGVGEEYSDLLEVSGVDTVPELSKRKAENLYQKLVETNQAKKLVRKMPTQAQVANWIDQAKKLPRVLQY